MLLEKVSTHFNQHASQYDTLVERIIPYYYEQNELLIELIPFEQYQSIKVLDLGCGTGVLSHLVLKSFQKAQVIAFDLAENMLSYAKQRLRDYQSQVEFKQGDFATDELGCGYNVIVSGLAIHHLDDSNKRALFEKLYNSMSVGGVLLIREMVLAPTEKLTKQYDSLWRKNLARQGLDDIYFLEQHMKTDIPASVENQLNWLQKVGFQDVGCHWRHLNFAIFGGRK